MSEVRQRYKDYLEAKGNKESAIKTTSTRIRTWFGDERSVSSLSPTFVEGCYEKRTEKVAVDTHRNELAEIKTFCRWLVSEGYLAFSPAEHIRGKGRRSRGKAQLRLGESQTFLSEALRQAGSGQRGHEAALAAAMCLLLGPRSGEVQKLKVRDIDEGLLWVTDAKTPAGERELEIPEVLWTLLEAQAGGRGPEQWLFPAASKTGHRTPTWLRKAVRRICRAAGVPVVCPQGLRGTHSTLGQEACGIGHLVAAQLGHESDATTMKHYMAPGTTAKVKARKVGIRLVG